MQSKAKDMRNSPHSSTLYMHLLESGCLECDFAKIMMVSGPLKKQHPLVALMDIHSSVVKEMNTGR